jgi:tripartite-type tricarboxylate transporter receptor subunit TctC
MNSIDACRTLHRPGPARAGRLVPGLVGRSAALSVALSVAVSVALSAALLLAACGSPSSGDQATALSNPELARAAAPIGDDIPTLTADEVAAAAAFYGRNTVSIIVGSGAGGGFDTTARLVARHIGRHIPGAPTAIVVNMPGGGGLVAANHVFNAAPKDGSVIGLFHEAQVMNQLTGAEGVQFDLLAFNWLGSSYDDPNVCIVRSDAPVTAFQDLIGRAEPIAIGGTAPGSNSYDAPRVLAEATGANVRTVAGYSTTSDARVGIERGEVQGMCLGWESVQTTSTQWLEDGYAQVFVQNGTARHRDLPHVPLALEFAHDDESRVLLRLLDAPSAMAKPFALPPGVDEDRVRVMRHALSAVYRDAAFLAEATAMRLHFQPKTAAEVYRVLSEVLATSPEIAAKYRRIIQP